MLEQRLRRWASIHPALGECGGVWDVDRCRPADEGVVMVTGVTGPC